MRHSTKSINIRWNLVLDYSKLCKLLDLDFHLFTLISLRLSWYLIRMLTWSTLMTTGDYIGNLIHPGVNLNSSKIQNNLNNPFYSLDYFIKNILKFHLNFGILFWRVILNKAFILVIHFVDINTSFSCRCFFS